MQYLEHTYTIKLFVVHLEFKFNSASCLLSGNYNETAVLQP